MDDFFIHKPTFKSLQGVVNLMDKAYKDTEEYFKNPSYKTLIMIPLKDEIVPRKPLIKLLKDERIKSNFSDKIKIETPIGHPNRRVEAIPLLKDKFVHNVKNYFSDKKADNLWENIIQIDIESGFKELLNLLDND